MPVRQAVLDVSPPLFPMEVHERPSPMQPLRTSNTDIEQLWQDYRNQLRKFLLARVRNPSDVDDLLQDILIKFYQNLKTVQQPSKLHPWLFQIARNTLIDYYRKARVDMAAVDINHLPQLDNEPEDYEQTRQELARCIRPFMTQLPDKYRETIDLIDLQGKSQKVLARELGLSHSAVKSRVQRGRRLLGALIQGCCHYPLDARGNPVAGEGSATVDCQHCTSK